MESANRADHIEKGSNITQTVPFLAVSNMVKSIAFYVDKLDFKITQKWVVDGSLRWCWLQRGGGALMLQQFPTDGHDAWIPEGKVGEGVTIYFICKDAVKIYHELVEQAIHASIPFVGNGMWTTVISDPDGYHICFESYTDMPEGTEYSFVK
jgi:catechol 2,3-dioxygenase-like lactoylglutathione lyase family enzyme